MTTKKIAWIMLGSEGHGPGAGGPRHFRRDYSLVPRNDVRVEFVLTRGPHRDRVVKIHHSTFEHPRYVTLKRLGHNESLSR